FRRVLFRSRPAAHREGVAAVTVPVTDQDVVTGAAVLDDVVGVATTQGVLHVVGRPTAHGQRVDPVTVPVTDQDDIVGLAVGEHAVRRAALGGVVDEV